jgi:hypothetical protein
MTTIVAWFNEENGTKVPWIVVDGRVRELKGSGNQGILTDCYPKLQEVPIVLYKCVSNGMEYDMTYSIGLAFAGNTLTAASTCETFQHIVSRLNGSRPGQGPSLKEISEILREIYIFHRNELRSRAGSITENNYAAEFIIAGYCHIVGCWKIFQIVDCVEVIINEFTAVDPLVIGSDRDDIFRLIQEKREEKEKESIWFHRAPLSVMANFCDASDSGTGGYISFGAGQYNCNDFQKYALSDISLDESGDIISKLTVNGFDASKVKNIIKDYNFFGFGLDAVPFGEKVKQLRNLKL